MDIRKARKEHQCSLCFGKINPGDKYNYRRLTPWDHSENDCFFDYKAHLICNDTWNGLGDYCDWELPMNREEWLELLGEC